MSDSSELRRIERLEQVLGGTLPGGVLLAIGDDAAALEPGHTPLVWTVDVQVEHVHFETRWLTPAELGYRATMAAASDLAAMGASARGVLASLVLPPWLDDDALDALAAGQAQAARELGTAVIGGNLARGSELSVTTTVLGGAARPVPRHGAEGGDVVLLAGTVGMAAAGLALLQRDEPPAVANGSGAARWREPEPAPPKSGADAQDAHQALNAWRRPRALLAAGLAAAPMASSAIDVSDGLALDASRLAWAAASRGHLLTLRLDPEALVSAELERVARRLGGSALELALHGGEDYALVTTVSAAELARSGPPAGFRRIGECAARGAPGPALALARPDGSSTSVAARGFDHFG